MSKVEVHKIEIGGNNLEEAKKKALEEVTRLFDEKINEQKGKKKKEEKEEEKQAFFHINMDEMGEGFGCRIENQGPFDDLMNMLIVGTASALHTIIDGNEYVGNKSGLTSFLTAVTAEFMDPSEGRDLDED